MTLSHTGDETTFRAADMVFTYDTDKLTYVSVDVPDSNCSVDAATAGTIHVQAYGEAKSLGKAFTLNFTVNASATGTATVTATSAKIDKSANAAAKDAPEAQLRMRKRCSRSRRCTTSRSIPSLRAI
ncbi:MAG: cohesin domain-containing protein [Holdemanella sp.]|uniref:cohesin domain-containing protein n=1 Tax=Holdemanella sp. TaxID=1971762 RepID=UPI003991CE5C